MVYYLMACIKDFKKDSYTFLTANPSFGMEYTTTWTETKEHNIYNNSGQKIGSYETKEEKSGVSEDYCKYSFAYRWRAILYWFLYPILRVISLVLSIIALPISLFTDRFYVQIASPEDYDDVTYSQPLHCWLDVVYKRRIYSREEYVRAKERKKQLRLEAKKNRYFAPIEIGAIFLVPIFPPVFIGAFLWGFFGTLVTMGNPERVKEPLKILLIWLLSLPVAAIYAAFIFWLIKVTA